MLLSYPPISKVINPTWFQYWRKEEKQCANSLTTNKATKISWMWPPPLPTSHKYFRKTYFCSHKMHNSIATPRTPLRGIPKKLSQLPAHSSPQQLLQPKKPHTTRFSLPVQVKHDQSAEHWGCLLIPGFGKHQELSHPHWNNPSWQSTRNVPAVTPQLSLQLQHCLTSFQFLIHVSRKGKDKEESLAGWITQLILCSHSFWERTGLGEKCCDLEKSQTLLTLHPFQCQMLLWHCCFSQLGAPLFSNKSKAKGSAGSPCGLPKGWQGLSKLGSEPAAAPGNQVPTTDIFGSLSPLLQPITTNTSSGFVWCKSWGESTAQKEMFLILPLLKGREAGTEQGQGGHRSTSALWCGTITSSLSSWAYLHVQFGVKTPKNSTKITLPGWTHKKLCLRHSSS